MAESHLFFATLYRFNADARRDVISRFDIRIDDRAATCRYDAGQDVFEVIGPLANGFQMNDIMTGVLRAYIDEELAMVDRQERPSNIERFEESCLDDFAAYYHSENSATEPTSSLTGGTYDETTWKPFHAGSELQAIFPLTLLADVMRAASCSLSIDLDRRCIVISEGASESRDAAAAKLTNIERNSNRTPICAHVIQTEKIVNMNVQVRSLRRLPGNMLLRTMMPTDSHLVDVLPYLYRIRARRYDEKDKEWVDAGRLGQPVNTEGIDMSVWDAAPIVSLSNGEPARTSGAEDEDGDDGEAVTPPAATQHWRIKGAPVSVKQWINGVGETEPDAVDSRPQKPEDALENPSRIPSPQTPALSRTRVPQGFIGLGRSGKEELQLPLTEDKKTSRVKSKFEDIFKRSATEDSESSSSSSESESGTPSDQGKAMCFRDVIATKENHKPSGELLDTPRASPIFISRPPITTPTSFDDWSGTAREFTPTSVDQSRPAFGHVAGLSTLSEPKSATTVTSQRISTQSASFSIPVSRKQNKQRKEVIYPPQCTTQVSLPPPSSYAQAVTPGLSGRYAPSTPPAYAPQFSTPTLRVEGLTASPKAEKDSQPWPVVTPSSPTTEQFRIKSYGETAFYTEPWAKKNVEAPIKSHRMIDDSAPAQRGPLKRPPGLDLPASLPSSYSHQQRKLEAPPVRALDVTSASGDLLSLWDDDEKPAVDPPRVRLPLMSANQAPLTPRQVDHSGLTVAPPVYEDNKNDEVVERVQPVEEDRRLRRTMGQRAKKKTWTNKKNGQPNVTPQLDLPEWDPRGHRDNSVPPAKKAVRAVRERSSNSVRDEAAVAAEPISFFSKHLEQILEHARSYQGKLIAEIQFGQVLMQGFAEADLRKRVLSPNQMAIGLNKASGTLDNHFNGRLTTRMAEALHISRITSDDGGPYFNQIPDVPESTKVLYEIHSQDSEGQVVVSELSPEGYHVCGTSRDVGTVNLHCPLRVWDARFTLFAETDVDNESQADVQAFLDTISVILRGDDPLPILQARTYLKIIRVHVKRHLAYRSSQHSHVFLRISEIRDLDIAYEKGGQGFRATVSSKTEELGLLWYEASLCIESPSQWVENVGLNVGDDASWTVADVIDQFKGLETLAEHVVSRMDGVGLYNRGPRGSDEDAAALQQKDEEKMEKKMPIIPYW